MALTPLLVAGSIAVAGAATAAHLATSPAPFSTSSAAVVAIGLVVYTTIAVTGVAVVRSRWAHRLSIVTVVADLAVVAIGEFDLAAWIALAAALAALGGLASRLVDGWFRKRRSATGPDSKAVLLLLGLGTLVPAVGVASPHTLMTAHGVLGSAGVILAWAYGKAQPWSLWAARLALPIVAAPAVIASPWPGGILLGVVTAALVALAWTSGAHLAVTPLLDQLSGPRPARVRPDDTDRP